MYDTGDRKKEKGSLLGDHAVAFWSVVSGIVAIITLVITIVTLRPSPGPGGGGSTPSPTPTTTSPSPGPTSPSPTPTSSLSFQYNGVSQYPCSEYQTIHSVTGGTSAPLVFVNQSSQPVQIDWINYGGARQVYDTLQAGQSYSVNTYTGDVWLVASYQADCLGYFYVNNAGNIMIK